MPRRYATTGGQFEMPMTVIGAGGTAPAQSLGAEHSQPFHAYVMGIPGLKICTAASPEAAYGLEFWEELNAAGVMGSFPVRPVPDQSVPKLAIEGSLVLVTGGGSGMGREICVQLAAEGANIAMCDMGEEGIAETKAICLEANNGGATVTTFTCDVSDESGEPSDDSKKWG